MNTTTEVSDAKGTEWIIKKDCRMGIFEQSKAQSKENFSIPINKCQIARGLPPYRAFCEESLSMS